MSPNQPVFVIDDEEAVRVSLGKLLRAIGFPSQTFDSAGSFLASDAVGSQGCLLLDLRMPGMGGIDLMAELERRDKAMPTIMMTGHTDYRAQQRLLETFRVVGLLEKPFTVEQLQEMLTRWQTSD